MSKTNVVLWAIFSASAFAGGGLAVLLTGIHRPRPKRRGLIVLSGFAAGIYAAFILLSATGVFSN